MRSLFKAIWSEISVELRTADAFRDRWYNWATNQGFHLIIGLTLTCVLTLAGLIFHKEIPDKWALWWTIAIAYAYWEIGIQRGKKMYDSIEDWWFTCIYGAGGAIFLFSEVQPGAPDLWASMEFIPPFLAIFWGHIVAGVTVRIWLKVRRK